MKAYLNGEEYIFSGGGSSQEIYSTEETRVGTWIDGRPRYRRVVTHNLPSSLEQWEVVKTGLDGWSDLTIPEFYIKGNANAIDNSVIFGLVQYNLTEYGTELRMYLRDSWNSAYAVTVCEYCKLSDS